MEINLVTTWPPPDWWYFIPAFVVLLAPIGVFVLRNKLSETRGIARVATTALQLVAGMSVPFALMFSVTLALAVVVGVPRFLVWALHVTFGWVRT